MKPPSSYRRVTRYAMRKLDMVQPTSLKERLNVVAMDLLTHNIPQQKKETRLLNLLHGGPLYQRSPARIKGSPPRASQS